jgi:hypothetical protein
VITGTYRHTHSISKQDKERISLIGKIFTNKKKFEGDQISFCAHIQRDEYVEGNV